MFDLAQPCESGSNGAKVGKDRAKNGKNKNILHIKGAVNMKKRFTLLCCFMLCVVITAQPAFAQVSTNQKLSSDTTNPAIVVADTTEWGNYADSLKQYDDHDGYKNNYKDYTMAVQLTSGGVISKKMPLTSENLGSHFLTRFQKLYVVAERPPMPVNENKAALFVTDLGIEYEYIAYENGATYTIQNGKTYYLGNSQDFYNLQLTFTSIILDILDTQKANNYGLPPINYIYSDNIVFDKKKIKPYFSADKYEVLIIFNSYANFSPPVLITDTERKNDILNDVNLSKQLYDEGPMLGGNLIIRIFNSAEHFDYGIGNDSLTDYQNNKKYAIPDTLSESARNAVAHEFALLYKVK